MTLRPLASAARAVLALGLCASAMAAERVVDRVAAVVDGEVIALSDVYALGGPFIEEQCGAVAASTCRTDAERDVLDALIRRTLQQQALRDLDADVGPSEVDGAIDTVVRDNQFPDREALRAEVERSGLSWEDYREELRAQIREMRFNEMVLRNRVTIPEDEIADAYRRLLLTIEPPQVLRLSAAAQTLPTDPAMWPEMVQQARAAVAEVRSGGDWEAFVAAWDALGLAPVFAGRTFREDELADALSSAVTKAAIGEVTDPVIAGGILYVLRVDAREEGDKDVVSFEDARPQLEQRLFEERMADVLAEWEARARRDASIRIVLGNAPSKDKDRPSKGKGAAPEDPAPEAAPAQGAEDDDGDGGDDTDAG